MNIVYAGAVLILVYQLCTLTINYSLHNVKSSEDNEQYLIQKNKNKDIEKENANKLARVNKKIQILIKSLSPNDERRKLLEEAPLKLQERKDSKEIGYTVNKGDSVGLCLEDNENALFFVTLHELSHVITKEYGHPPEFWKNFEFLVKKAVSLGIYNYKNYDSNPVNYCSYEISYTPYKK
jgi:hypothetical protein